MKHEPTTKDQQLYKIDGQLKAEIDVSLTREVGNAPSIAACRHAVLTIETISVSGETISGYVVYDRLLCRVVNGVYSGPVEGVLDCARQYNENPDERQDMAPNGVALNLKYPEVDRSKNMPLTIEDRS